MALNSVKLTLLVRAYCHLCDEMRQALSPLVAASGVAVDEIDVDSDSRLEALWGDKVPVLLAGKDEICHYRLDAAAVERFLGRREVVSSKAEMG